LFYAMNAPVVSGSAPFPALAFSAKVRTDQFESMVCVRPPGETAQPLQYLARSGTQAPGAPEGALFDTIFRPPVINDSGETAFVATTRGVVVSGIWRSSTSGALSAVALSGTQAPGLPPGVNYSGLPGAISPCGTVTRLSMNSAGEVAFVALLWPAPTGTGSAVFGPDGSGNLTILAREGDPVPGAPAADWVFDSLCSSPALDNPGRVAFRARIRDSGLPFDAHGVWTTDVTGQLGAVALAGQQAPGAPPGAIFDGLPSEVWDGPFIRDDGLVAFRATAAGPRGIWAYRHDLGLFKVVLVGDLLEIAPGDQRAVQWVGMLENPVGDDGRPTCLNGSTLVFRASFGETFGCFEAQLPP
jgi:hypothetical protein